MAPEQARGEAVDHRADLFSLGSVLYVAVHRAAAVPGDDILPVLRGVCDITPESPRRIRPTLPSWLERAGDEAAEQEPGAVAASRATWRHSWPRRCRGEPELRDLRKEPKTIHRLHR